MWAGAHLVAHAIYLWLNQFPCHVSIAGMADRLSLESTCNYTLVLEKMKTIGDSTGSLAVAAWMFAADASFHSIITVQNSCYAKKRVS